MKGANTQKKRSCRSFSTARNMVVQKPADTMEFLDLYFIGGETFMKPKVKMGWKASISQGRTAG